ncbi:hypothetical protein ACQKLP_13655 [Chitinophaga sp. NPDC101104]|uniref:hypothetical protein n=1 Tax=Chitinophaga sp. NPDC101104 TaxID=3390561 RepID=UPI003D03E5A3
MTIRSMLLEAHSRAQTEAVAAYIGKSEARLNELIGLFLYDEYRVVQRAAWPLRLVAEKYPRLVEPHLEAMVRRMDDAGIPVSVKRNVVGILQYVEVPERLHGPVMDVCFRLLEDVEETVAVRAFSMTVLANLAVTYPEIKNEIVLLIEDQLREGATPGFVSRAKKTLQALSKPGNKVK